MIQFHSFPSSGFVTPLRSFRLASLSETWHIYFKKSILNSCNYIKCWETNISHRQNWIFKTKLLWRTLLVISFLTSDSRKFLTSSSRCAILSRKVLFSKVLRSMIIKASPRSFGRPGWTSFIRFSSVRKKTIMILLAFPLKWLFLLTMWLLKSYPITRSGLH